MAQIWSGGQLHVAFEDSLGVTAPIKSIEELLALDATLETLARILPRQAKLVEGKFFGGFSWAELGELLGVSEATVMREWRVPRAWLACQMRHAVQHDAACTSLRWSVDMEPQRWERVQSLFAVLTDLPREL